MDFVAGDDRGELVRGGRLGERLELRRWEREEDLDRAQLGWASRFAFVTAGLLAERWGVSEQQMRARLPRLEQSGPARRPVRVRRLHHARTTGGRGTPAMPVARDRRGASGGDRRPAA